MIKLIVIATLPMLITGSVWAQIPPIATPNACANTTVVTGGTPVNALNANSGIAGGYITNPLDATNQGGIGAAENIYIDPTTSATTTGNGTNVPIIPGGTYRILPNSTKALSVNAVTNGHKFVCVVWR